MRGVTVIEENAMQYIFLCATTINYYAFPSLDLGQQRNDLAHLIHLQQSDKLARISTFVSIRMASAFHLHTEVLRLSDVREYLVVIHGRM